MHALTPGDDEWYVELSRECTHRWWLYKPSSSKRRAWSSSFALSLLKKISTTLIFFLKNIVFYNEIQGLNLLIHQLYKWKTHLPAQRINRSAKNSIRYMVAHSVVQTTIKIGLRISCRFEENASIRVQIIFWQCLLEGRAPSLNLFGHFSCSLLSFWKVEIYTLYFHFII